jgi:hypothetical protein
MLQGPFSLSVLQFDPIELSSVQGEASMLQDERKYLPVARLCLTDTAQAMEVERLVFPFRRIPSKW